MAASTTVAASRYELQGELGGGGMGVVYRVVDHSTGRTLALKRQQVRADADARRRAEELFAREFHTLAQLAHPRIVEVYDYGIDDVGPYYTMELLDGDDLQQLVPVDWRRLCAIARDVCSALSLLHSRRIVHRDISPRNIRCISTGAAKLIDFGAMVPNGPTKDLVGTPAYCAPEMLNLQSVDGRTDLYALGATLYYALTGQHAYPSTDFASLPNLWRFAIARPSELQPDIPEALDQLVLDLLQLEPQRRPGHAAEVMERLAAIEGKRVEEHLFVAQAYLSTPAFVGRSAELERVRAALQRAQRGRGRAMLVQGAAGVGRTRFLDASALAARLLGLTVLRADGDDSKRDSYGVLRALVDQLMTAAPDATRNAARADAGVLVSAFPQLSPGTAPDPIEPALLRPRLQNAVRQLFVTVSETHPLMIVVDDLDRADEPSAAVLAVLANALKQSSILSLASRQTGRTSSADSALRLFADAATSIELTPLERSEIHTLLASIFGADRALDALVERAYAVSNGGPRDVLRLAQHLLDRGVVRYQAGAWSLPQQIDASDLPSTISQLLAARVGSLTAAARELARAFALCPTQSFSFEECVALSTEGSAAQSVRDLEQLVSHEILRAAGERYVLADRAFIRLLLDELAANALADVHRRLAHVFERRGPEQQFNLAKHLMHAGERERAMDLFVVHAMETQELADVSQDEYHKIVSSLPEDWLQTYERALALCVELGRPRTELFEVRARLPGVFALLGGRSRKHIADLIAELKAAAGLDDWEIADPSLDPMARLKQALDRAQARYDAASERERTLSPLEAIRILGRTIVAEVGAASAVLDIGALRDLPALSPLAPLSPALGLVDNLARGVLARMTGRIEEGRSIYLHVLARATQPDRAGLGESHHHYMCSVLRYALGLIDAQLGLRSCLDYADQIQADPRSQVDATLIRAMHQLWQGNAQEVERLLEEVALLRVQNSTRQVLESTDVVAQVIAYAAMEDLTRLKRTLAEADRMATAYPGWRPVAEFGHAEYQRVCGDPQAAVTILEDALARTRVGDHYMWSHLAGAHVRALDDAGEVSRAVAAGTAYLAQGDEAQLGFGCISILLPLCVAQAKDGHLDAVKNAERVLERLQHIGTTGGLTLGLAHESRARVALVQNDRAAFTQHLDACNALFAPSGNPALFAKVQRVQREAERRRLTSTAPRLSAVALRQILKSKLPESASPEARAQLVLRILAEQSGASHGVLYRVTADGPVWAASVGSLAPTDLLQQMARDYLAGESIGESATDDEEVDAVSENSAWSAFADASFRPVLLSHYAANAYETTGLAVFAVAPGEQFNLPSEAAAQLSLMWAESGDVH